MTVAESRILQELERIRGELHALVELVGELKARVDRADRERAQEAKLERKPWATCQDFDPLNRLLREITGGRKP